MSKTRIGKDLFYHVNPGPDVDYAFTIETKEKGTVASIALQDGFSDENAKTWIIKSVKASNERDFVRMLEALKAKAKFLKVSRVCLVPETRRPAWVPQALASRGFQRGRVCVLGLVTSEGMKRETRRLKDLQADGKGKFWPSFDGIKPRAARVAAQAAHEAYIRQSILNAYKVE